MNPLTIAVSTAVMCLAISPARAALIERANGLVYDSVLNITWQKNANLAASQTFGLTYQNSSNYTLNANGSMNWVAANMWIQSMNASTYLGYSDWRLPEIDSPFGFNLSCTSFNGSTDCGYNISDDENEIAHLFYASLGNLGRYDTSGNSNPILISNTGPFDNLQPGRYWTGTQLPPQVGPNEAFTFDMSSGLKEWDSKRNPFFTTYAWAVRDGDSFFVPEPSTLALTMAALGCGVVCIRRRKRTEA